MRVSLDHPRARVGRDDGLENVLHLRAEKVALSEQTAANTTKLYHMASYHTISYHTAVPYYKHNTTPYHTIP